ncbi:hypothetical protein BD414DRAFT_528562 [Trametes punicea]|nr:hypothetical protein BD414DRAFT_528562 [Trametes punicea]
MLDNVWEEDTGSGEFRYAHFNKLTSNGRPSLLAYPAYLNALEMERTQRWWFRRHRFAETSSKQRMRASAPWLSWNWQAKVPLCTSAKTDNATRDLKDHPHAVKEPAMMAQTLPLGMWVRMDEIRDEAMWAPFLSSLVATAKMKGQSRLLMP